MKKILRTVGAVAFGLSLPLAGQGLAMDHSTHGGMTGDAKAVPETAAKSAMTGREVRSVQVDGYQFTYQLIDMAAMMKGMPMKGDRAAMKSHHLMVYVAGPAGEPAPQGKVGYRVTGPDKIEQKTMAMAMEGGFGADVDLKAKGDYRVKTKAVFGEKTIVDEFTYTVK